MDIKDYLVKGHANPTPAVDIALVIGVDERTVREMIGKARDNGDVILRSGGTPGGYFLPDMPGDLEYLKAFVAEEESRRSKVSRRISPAKTMLKKYEYDYYEEVC